MDMIINSTAQPSTNKRSYSTTKSHYTTQERALITSACNRFDNALPASGPSFASCVIWGLFVLAVAVVCASVVFLPALLSL